MWNRAQCYRHSGGQDHAYNPSFGPLLRSCGGFLYHDVLRRSIATVPVGKTQMATLRNIPGAIKDTKPYVMLSVPALSRSFKKAIEAAVKAKGEKVESYLIGA